MPVYKLYVLSVAGDVADCYDLVGQDDDFAIAVSLAKTGHRAMELWLRDRLVRRFPAAPGASREKPALTAEPESPRSASHPI